MYDHIDLFSGLGCWALAARANGLRTVAFCEREEWLSTGLERTWGVPCHRDIKTFPAKDYAGRVWLLTGSPPCQPASCAGKRRGKADDRWLWGPTVGVCEVIKPAWFIFENPPGLDGVGLDGIISDLERLQYEVATLRIPACAVNSPQLRDRFWIVGNRVGIIGGRQPWEEWKQRTQNGHGEPTQSGVVADSRCGIHDAWQDFDWLPFNNALYRAPVGLYSLADESTVVIPKKFRAKLISALGNAIVWPVAAEIIKAIKASDPSRPTHQPLQGNPP